MKPKGKEHVGKSDRRSAKLKGKNRTHRCVQSQVEAWLRAKALAYRIGQEEGVTPSGLSIVL